MDSFNRDKEAQIMQCLPLLEPNNRYQGVRTGPFGSIGNWLWKQTSVESGGGAEEKPTRLPYFDPGIQERERHLKWWDSSKEATAADGEKY